MNDMEDEEPLANVQADRLAAEVLDRWAVRLRAGHLADLLTEAVKQCPEHVYDTAPIVVDGHRYTIKRLLDGMHIQGEDADLTLRGPIVTGADGVRRLYLRWLTPPPPYGEL